MMTEIIRELKVMKNIVIKNNQIKSPAGGIIMGQESGGTKRQKALIKSNKRE